MAAGGAASKLKLEDAVDAVRYVCISWLFPGSLPLSFCQTWRQAWCDDIFDMCRVRRACMLNYNCIALLWDIL
jgi:hypothetical protein